MTQVLLCSHPSKSTFLIYPTEGPTPITECKLCSSQWKENAPEPRVVLGRLEVEGAGIDAGVCDDCRRLWESEPDNENIKICVHPKCFGALVGR
jgi:hypothetical protein